MEEPTYGERYINPQWAREAHAAVASIDPATNRLVGGGADWASSLVPVPNVDVPRETREAVPSKEAKRRAGLWPILAVLALASGALVGYGLWRNQRPASFAHAIVQRVSPQGRYLARVSRGRDYWARGHSASLQPRRQVDRLLIEIEPLLNLRSA